MPSRSPNAPGHPRASCQADPPPRVATPGSLPPPALPNLLGHCCWTPFNQDQKIYQYTVMYGGFSEQMSDVICGTLKFMDMNFRNVRKHRYLQCFGGMWKRCRVNQVGFSVFRRSAKKLKRWVLGGGPSYIYTCTCRERERWPDPQSTVTFIDAIAAPAFYRYPTNPAC